MSELWAWIMSAGGVLVALFATWFTTKKVTAAKEQAKAAEDKAAASAAAAQAVTEHQSTVVKEASNAEQKVANSSDTDVDSELLNNWQRKE